jgi:hypothetical protein
MFGFYWIDARRHHRHCGPPRHLTANSLLFYAYIHCLVVAPRRAFVTPAIVIFTFARSHRVRCATGLTARKLRHQLFKSSNAHTITSVIRLLSAADIDISVKRTVNNWRFIMGSQVMCRSM